MLKERPTHSHNTYKMIENDSLFYNWSNEDFTWKLNGSPYTFKAGSVTPVTKAEFNHFSKHFVDRELGKAKFRTNDELHREEYTNKCRAGELQVSSVQHMENLTALSISEMPKKFCEHCESKGVRHMKACTRSVDKQEEPFADAVADAK